MLNKLLAILFTILLASFHSAENPLKFKAAICLTLDKLEAKGGVNYAVSELRKIGFNTLVLQPFYPKLNEYITEGQKQGIDIYVYLTFDNPPQKLEQKILPEERKALSKKLKLIKKGKYINRFGAEPIEKDDIYSTKMVCFDKEESLEYYKQKARGLCKIPGIKGIYMDNLGYQNYYACFCEESNRNRAYFLKAKSGNSADFSKLKMVSFASKIVEEVHLTGGVSNEIPFEEFHFKDCIMEGDYKPEPPPPPVKTELCVCVLGYPFFKTDPNVSATYKFSAENVAKILSWPYKPHFSVSESSKSADSFEKEIAKGYIPEKKNSPSATFWIGISQDGKNDKTPDQIRQEIRIARFHRVSGIIIADAASVALDPEAAKVVAEELK